MTGKTYRIGIVGERSYQDAIRGCAQGDLVNVQREPDNPYDDQALAVVRTDGRVIGYIPRDSFLQKAVHKEGQGCIAEIASIRVGGEAMRGVVIEVELVDTPLSERSFVPAR